MIRALPPEAATFFPEENRIDPKGLGRERLRTVRFRTATAIGAVSLSLLCAGSASATISIPVNPDPPPSSNKQKQLRAKIVEIARLELEKNVREKNGNNIPRYRNGKGKIAPYSIGDAWCVAFGTWIWSTVGQDAFLGTRLLRTSHSGRTVAIQVRDLSDWADRNGHWTYRARPGDMVAYGTRHVGVVTNVNRDGRAVWSIEGNQSDAVTRVKIPMEEVDGYISPFRLLPGQKVSRFSAAADIE